MSESPLESFWNKHNLTLLSYACQGKQCRGASRGPGSPRYGRGGPGHRVQLGHPHRLTRITYPDATYEEFSYTPAGDLETYLDNMSQLRTLEYDDLHRLESVTYSDSSTILMSYDLVVSWRRLKNSLRKTSCLTPPSLAPDSR